MSGGSVRDRVLAAEALQRSKNPQDRDSTTRQGHRLSLKTDEHIKEEFLRKRDGGWSKNIEIGQQQPFLPIPLRPPMIKLTSDTPIVTKSRESFSDNLRRDVPHTVEPLPEELVIDLNTLPSPNANREAEASGPSLAQQRSSEKEIHRSEEQETDDSPAEGVYDEEWEAQTRGSRERSRGRERSVSSDDSDIGVVEREAQSKEGASFHSASPHHHRRHRKSRRKSRPPSSHRTNLEEPPIAQNRSNDHVSRRSFSHRARSTRTNDIFSDEGHEHEKRKYRHSSRSPSRHIPEADVDHLPSAHRRNSSHSLWPSFNLSERRSMSNLFETSTVRSRPSHSRTRSDITAEVALKQLEFVEYLSGRRLDHDISTHPQSQPLTKPMGYVRSRSTSGEYSEHFTRERTLLRKPSEGKLIDHFDIDRGRQERHNSWSDVKVQRKEDPWQVKLFQGIARM